MCYGPHEHRQMMQDMARRTEGLRAPRVSLAGVLAALGRWLGGRQEGARAGQPIPAKACR